MNTNILKKATKVILSLLIAFACFVSSASQTGVEAATRTDATVNVTSVSVTPATVQSGSSNNKVGFSFDITTPTGYPLTAGDTIELDTNVGTLFDAMDANLGAQNINIAQGVTASFTSTKVIITFGAGFNESTVFNGTVSTADTLTAKDQGETVGNDVVKQITVANATSNVTFHKDNGGGGGDPQPSDPSCVNNKWVNKDGWGCNFSQGATYRLHGNYMGALALAKKKAQTESKDVSGLGYISDWTPTTNNLIEDVIPNNGYVDKTSVNIYAIALGSFTATTDNKQGWPVGAVYPQELGTWQGDQNAGSVNGYTLITQNDGETYDAFKARVIANKNSYGIYTASTGGDTFVANMGDANYTDGTGDHAIVTGFRFDTYYPGITTTTNVTNTANMTCDAGNLGGSSAQVTIKRSSGVGAGNIGTVRLTLSDEDDANTKIAGAEFKIQVKDGNDWKDVIVNGNVLKGTTDTDGYAEIGTLGVGEYRVVQTSTAAHYSFTNDNYAAVKDDQNNTVGAPLSSTGEFTITTSDKFGFVTQLTNAKITAVTLTFHGNETTLPGVVGTATVPDPITVEPGNPWSAAAVSDATLNGYTFKEWNTKADGTGTAMDGTETATTDTDVYAIWEAKTDTAYTVEHYYENVDGTFTKKEAETESKTGTTGQQATATPKTGLTGYYYDTNNANNVNSGTIKGDGSLVLKCYYKQITYTVKFHENNGTGTMADESFKYEESKALTSNTFTRDGYTFVKWNTKADGKGTDYTDGQTVSKLTSVDQGVIDLYAVWSADEAKYTVEHYTENSDGTYSLYKSEDFDSETDASVTASPITIEGYTFDKTITGTVESGTVKADGSLTLKLYYKLAADYVIVDFDLNGHGDTAIASVTLKKGATVAEPTEPTDSNGFGFYGWFLDAECTKPYNFDDPVNQNTVLYAGWIDSSRINDGTYTVEHYIQNADGTYTIYKTDVIDSITYGSKVNATPLTIKGYTYDSSVSGTLTEGYVLPNTTLTLKLYYTLDPVETITTGTGVDGTNGSASGSLVNTGDDANIAGIIVTMIAALFIAIKVKKELN